MRKNTAEDFWERVDRSAGPDECHPFAGKPNSDGYGRFSWGGRVEYAHRVALFLINGTWPIETRHTCDTPLCCNGRHLIDGTHADNMTDKITRGRQPRGAQHGAAKLTDQDVQDIRANYALCRTTLRELAARFGVSKTAIGLIINGETWA